MRAVIQRVGFAQLHIDGKLHSNIEKGMIILLGIETEDGISDVEYLVNKISQMRIFNDENGKMNLALKEIGGECMIVSQFTLFADTKKGNRPSYIRAARPEQAIPLYETFINKMNQALQITCATGVFGADMKITLMNDGPVTIIIDSKDK
ncbi:MAG: D-aminoacyl-tRNA deacylase [Flavobacteriales bacterium]|jgi:D-tyrosyl-tRNA(Tyr) deacylase